MIVEIQDDFCLDKIADCGQCFRSRKLEDGSFLFISGEHMLQIRRLNANLEAGKEVSLKRLENNGVPSPASEQRFEVSCGRQEWDSFWFHYFDLTRDYSRIRSVCLRQLPDTIN